MISHTKRRSPVFKKISTDVTGLDPDDARVRYAGQKAEIYSLEDAATVEIRFFDDYDGFSNFAMLSADVADRIHRFGTDLDGDGNADTRRITLDGDGRVILSVFENGTDDADQLAIAYRYGIGDLITRTTWYDKWAAGTALGDQTIDRLLTVLDTDDDGTGESRRHDTYSVDGDLVIESLIDKDNAADGGWERAEGFEYDASDRLILHKFSGSVTGTDPIAATINWDMARIHILSGDGSRTETRFFDDYDGTSDFAALSIDTAARIHRFGTDHDGDGRSDIRRDTLDSNGRVTLSVFGSGARGTGLWAVSWEYDTGNLKAKTTWYDAWDSTKALSQQVVYRVLTAADNNGDGAADEYRLDIWNNYGEVVESLFDDAGDGAYERAEGYEYKEGTGALVLKKTSTDVDGRIPDDVAVDYSGQQAEIYILGGAGTSEIRFFDAYDGSSDYAELSVRAADRIHRFETGQDRDGDGEADVWLDALDSNGRVTLSMFENGTDENDRWAVAYDYGAGDLVIKTTYYDDWDATKIQDQQTISRALIVTDSDSDGTGDVRRHETWNDDGKVVKSLFDDDIAGGWDRAEGYEFFDDGGKRIFLKKTSDAVTGFDPDTATVSWDRAEVHFRDNNDIASQIWFFDNYDGLSGISDLIDDVADRRHYFGSDYSRDGNADLRRDTLDSSGRVTLSVFENGTDENDMRAIAYEYTKVSDYRDPNVRTIWYDSWIDGAALDDQTISRTMTVTDADGSGTVDNRRLDIWNSDGKVAESLFDEYDVGTWDWAERYQYKDGTGDLIFKETSFEVYADYPHETSYPETIKIKYSNNKQRAEIYILDETGTSEIRFFDGYAGTSDYSALSAATPNRIHYYGLELDKDGSDDARFDRLNESGWVVESQFDIDNDGADRYEYYNYDSGGRKTEFLFFDISSETKSRYTYTYDENRTADSRWLVLSEDFDSDGIIDRKTSVTYHSATDILATREVEYDDVPETVGTNDGIVNRRVHETFNDAGELIAAKYDDDNDGNWDRFVDAVTGAASRRMHDASGRIILSEFDDDGNKAYDRAVAYEYSSTVDHLVLKTTWYDDWAVKADGNAKALADQTVGRVLIVTDKDLDGTGESRRHDTRNADGDLVIESLFDTDNADDGSWERAEGYEFDAFNRLVLHKDGGTVSGTDPVTATIGWNKAEVYILRDGGGKAQIRFFDVYDGTSDFAALTADTANRIHYFEVELDSYGSDDARFDKLNGSGQVIESLFDIDSDGVDRAEAYTWDTAGRKTEVRFHDSYDGTFDLSKVSVDKIHSWTYATAADDDRWLTFLEDLDGDDKVDIKTIFTYHGVAGPVSTREVEYDDGSGGGVADDGTPDRRIYESFDDRDVPLEVKHDDDGDGVWDRIKSVSRHTRDDENRVVLSEIDTDEDGTYDQAVAYAYGSENLVVKTTRYDEWALKVDGASKALPDQVIARALTVTDGDDNGTGESRRHDTYSEDGDIIIKSLFDEDNAPDGKWEHAEGYEFDIADRHILFKASETVTGSDPAAAMVGWGRAEIYILNSDGSKAEIRFFDTYDGVSDFATLTTDTADRIHRFDQELDTDGSADDARFDKLDGKGRVVESLFDIDNDGVDRAEAYVWDAAGRKIETRFYNSYTGTFDLFVETADGVHGWTYSADATDTRWLAFSEDLDGDHTDDRTTTVIYHYYGNTDTFATRLIDYDDGTGAGVADDGKVDRHVRETFDDTGALVFTTYDDNGDGAWDRSAGGFPRYGYDGNGRVIEAEYDDDRDGTTDRTETYTRGSDAGITKRVIEYDDGSRAGATQDGTIDRRREEAWTDSVLTEVTHDYDADGKWDHIDTYSYVDWDSRPRSVLRVSDWDADGTRDVEIINLLSSIYNNDGADGRVGSGGGWILPGPGDDVVAAGVSELVVIRQGDGEDTVIYHQESPHFHETWDRIWIEENGIDYSDLTIKNVQRPPWNYPDASPEDGALISWKGEDRLYLPGYKATDVQEEWFLFGDDAILPDSNIRTFTRDDAGRITEARYYDAVAIGADPNGLDPDRVHRYTWDDESDEIGYWRFAQINDNAAADSVFETKITVQRRGNGDPISRVFEFDDGSNGGAADDGNIDRRRKDAFDGNNRIVEIRHDIDNDGKWDFIDTVTWEGEGSGPQPRLVVRVSTMDDDDGANDVTADAVRLVFGTDGDDRGAGEISGVTAGDEWIVTGRGNDFIKPSEGKDVYIFEYGDGTDVIDGYDITDPKIADSIWFRGDDNGSKSAVEYGGGSYAGYSGQWVYGPADVDHLDKPLDFFPESGQPAVNFFGIRILDKTHTLRRMDEPDYESWLTEINYSENWIMLKGIGPHSFSTWRSNFVAPTTVPHDPNSFIYGSRNAAWTLDDMGRVAEARFFDGWDGIGAPSALNLAPGRVHRYTYDGDGTDWKALSKNRNALEDDAFEYKVAVERDDDGDITKETILFDDGLGAGAKGRTAGDGIWDRKQENSIDTTSSTPQLMSSKYDHDNDGTWDVVDSFAWDAAVTEGPNKVTRTVSGAENPAATFIYGSDGADTKTGAGGVEWIDAGEGDDDITGGGGADVFIFRYGDGTDIIRDFETSSDTIWIREDGFDPVVVEASLLTLGPGEAGMHPHIPTGLFPSSGQPAVDIAVLTYGGGPDDRIIVVGGTSDADFYRGHFVAHDGHIPDFGGG